MRSPPLGMQYLDFPDGTYRMRIVQTGASIVPTLAYFYAGPGTCVADGIATGSSYFSATVVAPETFATLSDVTE